MPSSSGVASTSQTCQKLSQKNVQFFAAGNLGGRTLVIFMMEKNVGESNAIRTNITSKYPLPDFPSPGTGHGEGKREGGNPAPHWVELRSTVSLVGSVSCLSCMLDITVSPHPTPLY